MKHFFLITLVLSIFSCNETSKNNIIEGNIYIKLIDPQNIIYSLSDKELKKFKEEATNHTQNNYSDSEKKLAKYFKILIKHNLFKKPFFKLKIESGKIINVYTTNNEYLKLKKELKNFDKETEKIHIKFEGSKISDGIYDSDGIFDQAIYKAKHIVLIEKTKGITDWKK